MDPKHKNVILSNISDLVRLVSYGRLRPYLLNNRIFSASQLNRLDERRSPVLDMFVEIQRRGPTAFRKLLVSLRLSDHSDAFQLLAKGENTTQGDNSLLLDPGAPTRDMSNSLFLDPGPNSRDMLNGPVLGQDLTDSPIQPHNIAVQPARVLRCADTMTYKMTASPRGLALVIDNEDYDTLPPRRGSHVDSDCLGRLLHQLGFRVLLRRNLSRVWLEYELNTFATDTCHAHHDMAIVCILSHGENGTIICRNGEQVAVEDILRRFNNQEAPSLKGKPKYFLFQACRGLDVDHGVETDGGHGERQQQQQLGQQPQGVNLEDQQFGSSCRLQPPQQQPPVLGLNLDRNPSFEDMIVSFATIPGYVAYRNNVKGSWFVQCFCKVFMEFAHEEDLLTLLHRVSQELKIYSTTKGEKQMCETLLRGVYKKLYFNPGLYQQQTQLPVSVSVPALSLTSQQQQQLMQEVWTFPDGGGPRQPQVVHMDEAVDHSGVGPSFLQSGISSMGSRDQSGSSLHSLQSGISAG